MSKSTVSADIAKQLEDLADRTADVHDRELLKKAADLV